MAADKTVPRTPAVPGRVQPPSPSAWARAPTAVDAMFPTYGGGKEHFPQVDAELADAPLLHEMADEEENDEDEEDDADLQAALQVRNMGNDSAVHPSVLSVFA